MKPTGYCQNPKCKKPLYSGLKYCDVFCGNSARLLRWHARGRQAKQAAGVPPCTHDIPAYGVCIKCLNAKRREVYRANKKYYPGAKLGIPSASFPKGRS